MKKIARCRPAAAGKNEFKTKTVLCFRFECILVHFGASNNNFIAGGREAGVGGRGEQGGRQVGHRRPRPLTQVSQIVGVGRSRIHKGSDWATSAIGFICGLDHRKKSVAELSAINTDCKTRNTAGGFFVSESPQNLSKTNRFAGCPNGTELLTAIRAAWHPQRRSRFED